ncbi:hypothetical protein ACHAPJ_011073 [Fusarium lateritium]
MSHEPGGRGLAESNRQVEKRQVESDTRGERQINDPTVQLYSQVADVQRSWHDAQHTIASLRGREEIILARTRELTDENKQLREELADLRLRIFQNTNQEEEQQITVNDDRRKRRRDPPTHNPHERSSIADLIQDPDLRVVIVIDESDRCKESLRSLAGSYREALRYTDPEKNLWQFAREGIVNEWFCLKDVCRTEGHPVTGMRSLTVECMDAHFTGRKIVLRRVGRHSIPNLTIATREALESNDS